MPGCTLNLPSVRWLGVGQAGLFHPDAAAGDTQQHRSELFMSVSIHAGAVQNAGCRTDQICGYASTPIIYTQNNAYRQCMVHIGFLFSHSLSKICVCEIFMYLPL